MRKALGLTQQQVADATGIARPYVIRIEQNHVDLPTYETRQRIHAALGTTEDDLIALGIVRDAHGHMQAGAAKASGNRVTLIEETRPGYGAADAFIASLSPDQRRLLRSLIDDADATVHLDDARDDPAEERRRSRS